MAARERDEFSGQVTTGHEWDGIKELDNPLPRWWLMILYASIAWAVGMWILYPAWPLVSDYSKGLLGYSSRVDLASDMSTAQAARQVFADKIDGMDMAQIEKDPKLLEYALAGGKSAFGDNCAACHGTAAQGGKGYPNLSDDDWLWGGSLDAIQQTIQYGIRSGDDEARESEMPAFGRDEMLDETQIGQVAEYVLSLSGKEKNPAAAKLGAAIFAEQCVDCHGEDGKGNRDLGAPNLTDAIWLFGSDPDTVRETITNGRKGVMPHWRERLPAHTIKQLAIYVHSLGGGE